MLHLRVALGAVSFIACASAAFGQEDGLIPDKPYYRVGETVQVEYRFPGVSEDEYITLHWGRNKRVRLSSLGEGVVELPGAASSDGPFRLYVKHSLLDDPPSMWIWVFPDLDPWPDALSVVGGNRVRMEEEFTVVVQPPDGTDVPRLMVQLLRPASIVEGGAVERETLLDYEVISRPLKLDAPHLPGMYELRLLENDTDSVLACLPLEVLLPSAENVVVRVPDAPITTNASLDFTIEGFGQRFELFDATIQDAETKRVVALHRDTGWLYDEDLLGVSIRTPSRPGSYELVVSSRVGDSPELARLPLEIEQPKEDGRRGKQPLELRRSGPFKWGTQLFDVGDVVTVDIASSEEMSPVVNELIVDHGRVALGLLWVQDLDMLGGSRWEPRVKIDPIRYGQSVGFEISDPGQYDVQLGATGENGWVRTRIDYSVDFYCRYPVGSGTIRFSRPSYRPGSEMGVTLESAWPVEESGNFSEFWILTPSWERIWWAANSEGATKVLPLEGGIFQMRWYDTGNLVSALPFRVPIELEPDRLRVIGGRDVAFEEPIRVEVEIDDRPLFGHEDTRVVAVLMERGQMSPTGTWKAPKWIDRHGVKESETFEFRSRDPGRYEVRLYAGKRPRASDSMPQYLLARIPLEVAGPRGEVPVPIHADAPEPTDLPFRASDLGSAITDDIRMADVHCAEFRPLPMKTVGRLPGIVVDEVREENTDDRSWPRYPQFENYYPRYVDRVDVIGAGMPLADPPEWLRLLPPDLAAGFNEAWVLLAVQGKGIVEGGQDPHSITYEDDWVEEYRILQATTMAWNDTPLEERFGKVWAWVRERIHRTMTPDRHFTRLEGADAFLVMAKVKLGTSAEVRRFEIDGVPCEWSLPGASCFSDASFARSVRDGKSHLGLSTAYVYDRVQVEIRTTAVLVANEVPFFLKVKTAAGPARRVKVGKTTEWKAKRTQEDPRLYRSEPFFLNQVGRPNRSPDPALTVIGVGDGDLLLAQVPRSLQIRPREPALARITTSPGRDGELWKEAVFRAAKVAGKKLAGDVNSLTREQVVELTQSGFFPGSSELGTEIRVGDLAAMILMRDTFVKDMRAVRDRFEAILTASGSNESAAKALRYFMYEAARGPSSPIGKIKVPDRVDGPQLLSVAFALVYNADYLANRFKGSYPDQLEWRRFAVRTAVKRYVDAVDYSLKRAEYVTDSNVRGLMEITGVGFDVIRARLAPSLVRLREDRGRGKLWWEPDLLAMSHMKTIGKLFDEWSDNKEVLERENDIILAVSMLVFVLPEYAIVRIASTIVAYATFAEAVFHDVPGLVKEVQETKFAYGASAVLGEGRLELAKLDERSLALVALNLVGSWLDLTGTMMRTVEAVDIAHHSARSSVLIEAIEEGGAGVFKGMGRQDQARVVAAIADAEVVAAKDGKLSELQQRALDLEDEFATVAPPADPPPASSTPHFPEDEFGTVPPPAGPPPARVTPHPLEDRFGELASRTVEPEYFRRMVAEPLNDVEPLLRVGKRKPLPLENLLADRPWNGYDVGGYMTQGAYARVYAVKTVPEHLVRRMAELGIDPSSSVVLKTFKGKGGPEALERSLHVEKLLAKGRIPQMPILEHGVFEGRPYLIQLRVPKGSIMYASHSGVGQLPRLEARAVAKLYADMGRSGILWMDGHLKNVFILKRDKELIAGVLDQDQMWRIEENILDAEMHPFISFRMNGLLRNPGGANILSMQGATMTERASKLCMDGWCMWPDGEMFMMKMLEQKGYIKYDRATGEFIDGIMKVDDIEDLFPRLRSPDGIDSTFEVPERFKSLPDPPEHGSLVPQERPVERAA